MKVSNLHSTWAREVASKHPRSVLGCRTVCKADSGVSLTSIGIAGALKPSDAAAPVPALSAVGPFAERSIILLAALTHEPSEG